MRRDIPINFDWQFIPSFDDAFVTASGLPEEAVTVSLPHTVKELPYNDFDERSYQFVSTYVKEFATPERLDGDRVSIRFGAVMTTADVWLNGQAVGSHEGGFTPFGFDITALLIPGGSNRLVVRVDSREIKDVPPFGHVVDYLCYGGIYREVTLKVRPALSIRYLHVKTLEAPSLTEHEMVLEARVALSAAPVGALYVTSTITRDGVAIGTSEDRPEAEGEIFILRKRVPNIDRWDLDHPVLYELETVLSIDGIEADRERVRFGFRTAQFTKEGFVLNNHKIKLVGLNRHQSYPYVGYAMPKRIQAKDAEILKRELGCNLVRTSHYMQSDHFIDRCDELGLLVFEEIPGWQYIGNEHFKELSCKNVEAMILHHYNHPSIVLWGVRINESADDHEFYQKTNEIAHTLDDSRQTAGVRNFKKSELLEDVYTYNDFSHIGTNPGLVEPRKVTGIEAPYLVTEHNGHIFPTKKFDHEQKRIEHALRHMAVLDASFRHEDACGAVGWCMSDYNTHVEFGSGDRICYHGVTDMFRIPKYAAAVYASQQDKTPVLCVASAMTMGDHAQSRIPPTVLFTNCDCVKVYRNGKFIDVCYADWVHYPHVPHAPVVVDDYYGNQIEESGEYPKDVAKTAKKLLIAFGKYGIDMPFADKLRAAWLMGFRGFTFADAERLYGKYIGDWGTEGSQYVFEGYRGDQLVATVVKGAHRAMNLSAIPDDTVLIHGDTYDATRIVVRLGDERGNDLPYGNDAFTVETTAGLEVIGPKVQALIGGSIGVYVKTTGAKGDQEVRIAAPGRPELTIAIRVE